MFSGFSHSVMGASHVKKGTVCQDASAHKVTDRYAIAVVADGHGSKKHFRSNIGSRCAVEATIETIDRFYANPDEFEENFPRTHKMVIKNIEKQIISAWNAKIFAHYKANPITNEEKRPFARGELEEIPIESYYGTTLVAAVTCEKFTFGFQLGDGSLVAVFNNGEAKMIMDYEESNPANITSSMCNSNAASMFNSFYVEERSILAVYASTDGLYTSFGSDNDFLDYHTIITGQLCDIDFFKDAVIKNMKKRSHFGTEDDISISCVFNCAMIAVNIGEINNKIEENKQRAKERRARLLNR